MVKIFHHDRPAIMAALHHHPSAFDYVIVTPRRRGGREAHGGCYPSSVQLSVPKGRIARGLVTTLSVFLKKMMMVKERLSMPSPRLGQMRCAPWDQGTAGREAGRSMLPDWFC